MSPFDDKSQYGSECTGRRSDMLLGSGRYGARPHIRSANSDLKDGGVLGQAFVRYQLDPSRIYSGERGAFVGWTPCRARPYKSRFMQSAVVAHGT